MCPVHHNDHDHAVTEGAYEKHKRERDCQLSNQRKSKWQTFHRLRHNWTDVVMRYAINGQFHDTFRKLQEILNII